MHPNPSHQNHLPHRQQGTLAESTKPKRIDGMLHRWLRNAARQWRRRKMIAALEAMDERLLRDIGIYRSDIHRVVDGLNNRELRVRPIAPSANPVETCDGMYRKAV